VRPELGEREEKLAAGGLAPNLGIDIKQVRLSLVGLAGQNWPISNTPPVNSMRRPTPMNSLICTVQHNLKISSKSRHQKRARFRRLLRQ
jgi:hypothetical protein